MSVDLAHQLRAIVAARGPALRAAASYAPATYARTLVDRTATSELWLLGWLPDQHTEIHDHGGPASASVILTGRLLEEQFRVVGPGAVVCAGTALHATGTYDLTDRDHVHRVRAVGGPVVSLHLYAGHCATRTYELAGRAHERVA